MAEPSLEVDSQGYEFGALGRLRENFDLHSHIGMHRALDHSLAGLVEGVPPGLSLRIGAEVEHRDIAEAEYVVRNRINVCESHKAFAW